jgi:hypothetical protein
MTDILGKQATARHHLRSSIAMNRGVDAIKSMGKHTHRREPILDGCSVSTHVDAIGQTTYNEHIGTLRGEVAHKTLTKTLTIVGAFASTHNTHHTTRIEISSATIEKQNGSIVTFTKP